MEPHKPFIAVPDDKGAVVAPDVDSVLIPQDLELEKKIPT